MSRENAEFIRAAIETFIAGDVDRAIDEYFDIEGEFVSRFGALEGGRYRGEAGARQYFKDIAEAWESYDRELVEVIDAGESVAVAIVNIAAVARTSGVPMERRIGIVFWTENGKIMRMSSYPTLDDALEAAGDPPEL